MNINKILKGEELIVAAIGKMSKDVPSKHYDQKVNFISKDGTTVNGESVKTKKNIEQDILLATVSSSKKLVKVKNKKSFISTSYYSISNVALLLYFSLF